LISGTLDLRAALQKRKPAKRLAQLGPRPAHALVGWTALPGGPLALLLDTNVYIARAAGRLMPALRDLIDHALLFHCSVALAELAVGVGNADPSQPGWTALRDHYSALFETIPASRLIVPDADIWTDAGVIAGTLARTQGFQPHQRKTCLNDALIFLAAAKAGLPVLTANRVEFDLIQQLAPEGRFIHY
jgi:predicted nucleic acid-binding protein